MITADIQATLNKLTIDRAGLAQCTANLNQAEKTAQTIPKPAVATMPAPAATAPAQGNISTLI